MRHEPSEVPVKLVAGLVRVMLNERGIAGLSYLWCAMAGCHSALSSVGYFAKSCLGASHR
jgi:hypothetical protein